VETFFFDRDNGMQKSFANADLDDPAWCVLFLQGWTRPPIGMAQ
jgi:hypothetical protein